MNGTDSDLVRLTLSGDHAAFAALVERHSGDVTRIVSEIVRDRTEIEDIVQECFIKAYLGLDSFREDAQFRTWLLRIAHNVSVTRSQRFVRRTNRVALDETAVSTAADEHGPLPDELVGSHEIEDRIAELIDRLPEHYRVVIMLYYYSELTYEEIAEVTGRPLNTVKAHLHRAKARLRDLLEADSEFDDWRTNDDQ